MSGADVKRPWPGEPQKCRCARAIVGTLDETLGCPGRWRYVAGTGWAHDLWGPR